mmetsp:Transcript_9938/g.22203  ORF Transcript_9938/g.22203 Transcript_9938/m.22203 type:complete len:130 (-) Transcript_9938:320-709(-)
MPRSLAIQHSTLTRVFVSFGLRTAQFLFKGNEKALEPFENNSYIKELQKAQINESEYAGLIVAMLLFFATKETTDETVALGTSLAVTGQIGYVWARTALGYPAIPAISMALIRYGGLGLLSYSLYQMAF